MITSTYNQTRKALLQKLTGKEPGCTISSEMRLAQELNVSRNTIRKVLAEFEQEEILNPATRGAPRTLKRKLKASEKRLKVAIVCCDSSNAAYQGANLKDRINLLHLLKSIGRKSSIDFEIFLLKPRATLIKKHFISRIKAIYKEGYHQMVAWQLPLKYLKHCDEIMDRCCYAYHGLKGKTLVAPSGEKKIIETLEKMIGFGHRKIIIPDVEERRVHGKNPSEEITRAIFKKHGLNEPTQYHLPLFEDNGEAFRKGIENYFRLTPPTAIISLSTRYTYHILNILAQKRFVIGKDISLCCFAGMPDVYEFLCPNLEYYSYDRHKILHAILKYFTHPPENEMIITIPMYKKSGSSIVDLREINK